MPASGRGEGSLSLLLSDWGQGAEGSPEPLLVLLSCPNRALAVDGPSKTIPSNRVKFKEKQMKETLYNDC